MKKEEKKKENKEIKDKSTNQFPKINLEKNKFNTLELILIFIMALLFGLVLGELIFSGGNNSSSLTKEHNKSLEEIENVYNTVLKEYIGEVNETELKEAAINGMMNLLDDNYSLYYSEEETEELNQELQGYFYGMGTEIYQEKDKLITINKVFENSPAEKAGLKKGDEYLKINGTDVTKKNLEEVSEMIKNQKNKTFNITIKRKEKEITKQVTIGKVEIPSVESEIINKNNKKIGYISISIFANNTDEQFERHLHKMNKENINKLIIDVRDNVGGELDAVVNITSNFLTKKDIILQTATQTRTKKIYSTKNNDKEYEIVVLINGGSASGSEVLASALNENCKSQLVGTTTFGKGTVQKTKTLTSGSMIKYTIETWKTSKGNSIDKKGIKPTLEIKMNEKYYKTYEKEDDNQLQKAIELLTK